MQQERSVATSNPFVSGQTARSPSPDVDERPRSSSTKKKVRSASYDDSASRSSFTSGDRAAPFDERSTSASDSMSRGRSLDGQSQRQLVNTQRTVSSSDPANSARMRYAGTFAPNPSFIRLLRFMLYGLVSLSSLITAGFAISVVAWYNNHEPSIKPSWGSLIALIVFGIITPGSYFGTFLITPRLFRYGTFAGIVNQVRTELILLFSFAVIWVSGALAMAVDLRGYENCQWDGYYHYPKPADFHDVCDLINTTVIMGYLTFGLVTLTWVVVTFLAIYILLYLDQEVLSELTNDMGGRAYRARTYALALQQQRQAALERERSEKAYSEKPSHRRAASYAGDSFGGTQTARPISDRYGGDEGRAASRNIPSELFYGRSEAGDTERSSRRGGGPMMAASEREQRAWEDDMRDA